MNINTITAEDLRRMPDKEGLILQGCGGDLTEFARLQNGVLAQFTTQREILFAGQPFQAPESYLRNAELYEEGQTGNYNMLDGRLNNEPPVRPDLTDGQTDEEIRELVPEAKPSLMDRLKADKPEHEARQMIPPVPERER